jgi:hypothetical protein
LLRFAHPWFYSIYPLSIQGFSTSAPWPKKLPAG